MAELNKADPLFLAIGQQYEKNKQTAGQAPFELFKGMRDGDKTIEELYLIAVKGLAACLGDSLLVTTTEKFLKDRKS